MADVRDLSERAEDVIPPPLIFESASHRGRDERAPLALADAAVQLRDQPALEVYVYTHAHTLAHTEYDPVVGRISVVLDDKLVARVMRLYGLRTKREAINFAVRSVDGQLSPRGLLALEGIGWEGDLRRMRGTRKF